MNSLRSELGLVGAIMTGLGSVIGTGVFVSIGIAAGIAGPAVLLAIVLAAMLATCNALSSAQLAASHAVSGGTYEYGYKYLRPWLGFTAGWMFLCAKSASAATAGLGIAGYLLGLLQVDRGDIRPIVAVTIIAIVTLLVLAGTRRTNRANLVIVGVTLGALLIFVLVGLPDAARAGTRHLKPFFPGTFAGLLEATALMFVAYTGYARIATLGEEVRDPRRTIPRAIVWTLAISAITYIAVAAVSIAVVGAEAMQASTTQRIAPLEAVGRHFSIPNVRWIVAIGALTAMFGVLLNLLLGLSRVLLAMGRRGDLPRVVSELNTSRTTPYVAVLIASCTVCMLALLDNVKTTWSFSAFSVCIYYSITHLAALQLPEEERLYPRFIAWLGLGACLALALSVERNVWLVGLALLGAGLIWHGVARWLHCQDPTTEEKAKPE